MPFFQHAHPNGRVVVGEFSNAHARNMHWNGIGAKPSCGTKLGALQKAQVFMGLRSVVSRSLVYQSCFCRRAHLVFSDAICELDNLEAAFDHIKNTKVGDDAIDDTGTGQR